jgi:hypothetical protein
LVFTKDPFLVAAALADRKALAGVVALKAAIASYNFLKAVGSEIVLRKANKKKRTEIAPETSPVGGNIAPAGVVFSIAEIGTGK